MRVRFILTLGSALLATNCIAGKADYIDFPSEKLRHGKHIWLQNCETCHAYGIAGAPVPMHPSDWKARLQKDKSVLYEHAIYGFFGQDDSMMPARGGNKNLTDKEVRMAVDYMVDLARIYINQHEEKKDDKR